MPRRVLMSELGDRVERRIHCFYCDRTLTSGTAYMTPYGKTSCLEDYREFHGGGPIPAPADRDD